MSTKLTDASCRSALKFASSHNTTSGGGMMDRMGGLMQGMRLIWLLVVVVLVLGIAALA